MSGDFLDEKKFQSVTEVYADSAVALTERIAELSKKTADVGMTRRYLSLARTAAEESELWLGKAMVAYAGRNEVNSPQG